MSEESTREVVTRYIESEHSDVGITANDVVFTVMATRRTLRASSHRWAENSQSKTKGVSPTSSLISHTRSRH